MVTAWRSPWSAPAAESRRFEVTLVVRKAEAVGVAGAAVTAVVTFKGAPRAGLAAALRREVKRNCTRRERISDGGLVVWEEEFKSVCGLASNRHGVFRPWEIAFSIFNEAANTVTTMNKASMVGAVSMNLGEHALAAQEGVIEISLPLLLPSSSSDTHPTLHLSLSLMELSTSQETSEFVQKCMLPFMPPCPARGKAKLPEHTLVKSASMKMKILASFRSFRKTKEICSGYVTSESKAIPRKSDGVDSLADEVAEEDAQDGKEGSSFMLSLKYGSLASANHIGSSAYRDAATGGEYEDWVYYSYHGSQDDGSSQSEEVNSPDDQSYLQASRRILLPWRKKKLSFRSPKDRGEPLLRKGNGEEGGDDIDYYRRQLSSSDKSALVAGPRKGEDDSSAHSSSVSDFGDDSFVVGAWEPKDVVSRDGHMKLSTQVFFASIDQRSERAAGESACTALVAVIADWFQSNQDTMPIKSQFDSLIREGSLEWRNLCEDQAYRERFPDRHFDLDTVIQAKIRPLAVDQGKSFVGFFHPEFATEANGAFDFLDGAMSFDGIWEEICRASDSVGSHPLLYIVSWNDHFFLLKAEQDAYYIIDTLGERLCEGGDRAYILKFDDTTSIRRVSSKRSSDKEEEQGSSSRSNSGNDASVLQEAEEIVCKGRESCKEYIKSFLAAIPIRELQADINKGLKASTPLPLLHHRLQIEFHCTTLPSSKDTTAESSPPSSETASLFSWPEEGDLWVPSNPMEMVPAASVFSWPEQETMPSASAAVVMIQVFV